MPKKYQPDDLLTINQVAEEIGYTPPYLRMLVSPAQPQFDPTFYKLRIFTDATWRKAFDSQAKYVFRYADVVAWFNTHQERPTVQIYNEARGIIVE